MNNDSSSSDTEDSSSLTTTRPTTDGGTAETTEDLDTDLVNEADRKPHLFTFHMVNSYGSAEVETIRNDSNPIKFSSKSPHALFHHPYHQRAQKMKF